MSGRLIIGNCLEKLRELDAESVHCCVTSPPYWGLRKYAGEQECIFGGDAECVHVWGSSSSVQTAQQTDFARSGLKRDGRPETARQATNTAATDTRSTVERNGQGSFCLNCGAWHGAYGLEPSLTLYIQSSKSGSGQHGRRWQDWQSNTERHTMRFFRRHEKAVPFSAWVVLELLGHTKVACHLSEQQIGGHSYLLARVPNIHGGWMYERTVSHESVYGWVEKAEAEVRLLAADWHQWAPYRYEIERLAQKQLFASNGQDVGSDNFPDVFEGE